ncbi:MAG: hypothetical protein DMG97_15295 [Acidobacteria bacterium]|nr:MAG: hypothetical protein DMG97_15295 [Acidobacteriota bacterium]PYV75158.1 MAG: hypothetical protein DMG96_17985 [Acidobacteriota bacterium]
MLKIKHMPVLTLGFVFLVSLFTFSHTQPDTKTDPFADFRPRHEVPSVEFVGRQVCAGCHMQRNRSQLQTAMAHALNMPGDSTVLQAHPKLTFRAGIYTYTITTEGQQSSYSVTDGKETSTEPIAYVFGKAHVAQTYVLRHNGKLYEGRVSYYTAIDNLDWTIGDALNPPPSLEVAFGRDITGDEARNCFSCHSTGAVVSGKLELDRLTPGVTCEACHGPGQEHVAEMHLSTGEGLGIFNPRKLSPDTLSQEFCGACHRSANAVGMMPNLGGITNVRFQPYRLSGSPGHDPNDPHFACTACHDPHIDLPLQGAAADSKCTVCHVTDSEHAKKMGTTETSGPRSCPVAMEKCDSCHMPRVEIPGTHFKFTDHRIRIVRPGAPYPL